MFPSAISGDYIVQKAPNPIKTFRAVCEQYIPLAIDQTKQTAAYFREPAHSGQSLYFELWKWARKNFQYREDRKGYEQIRLPRKSWADRKTGIDCEDFVILLSAILHNLHISHRVRMADYGDGWQHIYLKAGEITLDPVNPSFNREPAFSRCKDHEFTFNTLGSPVTREVKNQFVAHVSTGLQKGTLYSRTQLQNLANTGYGIADKDVVKELAESAYLRYCLWIVDDSSTAFSAFNRLVEGYERQANSSLRTSESIMLQQYSTPLPMGYLMGAFCGLGRDFIGKTLLEPSAGNGFLLVAAGSNALTGSVINEIAPNRYENLSELQLTLDYQLRQRDATDPHFYAELPQFDAVIANPPFGVMERLTFDLIQTQKIDHWIILNTLAHLKKEGKAGFIIGGHTHYDAEGRISSRNKTTGDRYFFNYLYHHYHVADIINVNGELYSRQGTQFDVRIILIDGRKEIPEGYALSADRANQTIVQNWQQLWQRISPHFADRVPISASESISMKTSLTHNTAKNGIEVKFVKEPDTAVINWMKANGYRWSRTNRLWFVVYTEDRWKTANEKFSEGTSFSAPASTPTIVKSISGEESALEKSALFQQQNAGQMGYYGLNFQQFVTKINELTPVSFSVKGIEIQLLYKSTAEVIGSHLPKGRKRPDVYSLSRIHDLLQNEYLKAGGTLSFFALASNQNNRNRFLYSQDVDYFIRAHPQQAQAKDYPQFLEAAAQRTRIKTADMDKWNAYRQTHFRKDQEVYVRNNKPITADRKFIRATIDTLRETSFYPSRYDTLRVVIQWGYIHEIGDRLLTDVYLENPQLNPNAKNVTELYPIEDGQKVALPPEPLTPDKPDRSNELKVMEMEAEALELELELELELLRLIG